MYQNNGLPETKKMQMNQQFMNSLRANTILIFSRKLSKSNRMFNGVKRKSWTPVVQKQIHQKNHKTPTAKPTDWVTSASSPITTHHKPYF